MTKKSIKDLPGGDRPREKLLAQGEAALSISELLAILIGSGNKEENAVQLCQRILAHAQDDLSRLSRYSLEDLKEFKGVGEAKALSIKAALELGRRRLIDRGPEDFKITDSKSAYDLVGPKLMDLAHEEFWVLLLSRSNVVMHHKKLSSGGLSGTMVDPKMLFKYALGQQASAIILAHNHPSGNLKPSQADRNLTKKIRQGAEFLDIRLLDHLIIGKHGYYSFADEGLLDG